MSDPTTTATSHSSPRVAIVTGAAQGLGLAIALRLAEDGLDIALNDIKQKSDELQAAASEIRARGRRAVVVFADVSSEEDVKTMVASTVDQLGGLDVMVANAGIGGHGSIIETPTEEWDRIMAVNGRGVMLCYKYAALQMIKQGRGGRILGASSIAGMRALKNASAYSSAKFVVRALTQSAALDFAHYNITVNAYAPGFIMTPIWGPGAQAGRILGAAKEFIGHPADCPEGPPEAIASTVSYLAKPEAFFITGQTITIDGGINLS